MRSGEYNIGKCLACPEHPEMDWPEMVNHAETVHGLKRGSQATRNMVMHLDGRDYFEWRYEWDLGNGVKIAQATRTKRSKDDLMRWA